MKKKTRYSPARNEYFYKKKIKEKKLKEPTQRKN